MNMRVLKVIRSNSHLVAPELLVAGLLISARFCGVPKGIANATFGLPICVSSLHTPPLICAGLKRLYRL